jgi:hypothetical protein
VRAGSRGHKKFVEIDRGKIFKIGKIFEIDREIF